MRSIKSITAASTFSRVEKDAVANDAADEIVTLVRQMDYFMITEPQRKFLADTAGAALANRFVFACLDNDPEHERAVWVFAPLDIWATAGQIYTIPAPLERFLPQGAEEIAEGIWLWIDGKSKADRAIALMAEGFIWDEDFQNLVDASQSSLISTLRRLQTPSPSQPKGPSP